MIFALFSIVPVLLFFSVFIFIFIKIVKANKNRVHRNDIGLNLLGINHSTKSKGKKIKCEYCGLYNDNKYDKCQYCGAALDHKHQNQNSNSVF